MSFGKEKMAPLKAIMALMIVATHLASFYDVRFFGPFVRLAPIVVSIFFFISGYGLFISYAKNKERYLQTFFKSRFLKVLLPLLVTTFVYWIILKPLDKSLLTAFNDLIIYGNPILPYSWFAIEILVFYVLFYLSFSCFGRQWKIVVMFILSVLLMVGAILAGYSRAWWVTSLAFPTGMLFALFEKRIYGIIEKYPWSYWLSIGMLATVFFLLFLTGQQYAWTLCYVCLPLIVALLVARLPVERLSGPIVQFLAMVSYEIYLCQGIAMELFRGKLYITNDYLFVAVVFMATIFLAWAIHCICRPLIRMVRQ